LEKVLGGAKGEEAPENEDEHFRGIRLLKARGGKNKQEWSNVTTEISIEG